MRNRFYFILCILPSFILLSCAPANKYSILYDEYKKPGPETSIAILLKPQKPIIINEDDVLDDLGKGIPEYTFYNYFKERFPLCFKEFSICSDVYFEDSLKCDTFINDSLTLYDNQPIQLSCPKNNSVLYLKNGTSPAYILFIENLVVGRGSLEEISSPLPNINNSITVVNGDKLFYKGKYILWDNKNGKLCGYGKIMSQTYFSLAMTKSTWDASIYHIAQSIIKNSPFRNEKLRYRIDTNTY